MSTNFLRRHPSTPPGPPPHQRRAAPGPWTSSSGPEGFQSALRYLIPRCETLSGFLPLLGAFELRREADLPQEGSLREDFSSAARPLGSEPTTDVR
jgi:hypothetical protein